MEVTLTIQNKTGLHARPAALFVQTASQFAAAITLVKDGREVNAKSILSVMSLGMGMGDTVVLRAEGADAEAAVMKLSRLVNEKFGEE